MIAPGPIPENATLTRWPPAEYVPEHHQADMHEAAGKADFRALISGVGGGKTCMGAIDTLQWALKFPGCSQAIIAPDFRTWRNVIKPECERWWPDGIWRETAKNELVEVDAGSATSKIFLCSASNNENVKRINGLTLTNFWIEEAARMNLGELAWKFAVGRRRETVAPYRGGLITGSPAGYNWLTDAFGIDTGLPPVAYTHGMITKTVTDEETGIVTKFFTRGAQSNWNTHNPPDFMASLLAVYGGDERFVAQEVYGRILSQTDRILYNFYRPLNVVPHDVAMNLFNKFSRSGVRTGGVDWGDRLAAMTWGATSKGGWEHGTMVTIGEVYNEGLAAEDLGEKAVALTKEHGRFRWYCDPEDAGSIRKWRTGFATRSGTKYNHVLGTVPPTAIKGRKWNQWKPSIDLLLVYLAYISRIEHPAYDENNTLGGARWYVSEKCVNLIDEIKRLQWAPRVIGAKRQRVDAVGLRHAIDCERYRALGERMILKVKPELRRGF